MGLLLRAVDAAEPLRWRWLLTDADTGATMADHPVDLTGARDEVARFASLYGHVSWYAAPDRRVPDGTRLVGEAGEWAGRVLLGADVTAAITAAAEHGPVTVTVSAAPPADTVLLWPLELAHAVTSDGRDEGPLAARGDVTFSYDLGGGSRHPGGPFGQATREPASQKAPVGDALRILAVFSQPATTDVLALRKERYELSRLIRTLAARHRAAIELRVVQYGTTRDRLKEIADDGDGWDVLHLSGHGGGGAFLLEREYGSPDLVPAADLVALLRPARRRAKLAIVSACESAADATAQTYRLLGLTEQAEALEAETKEGAAEAETQETEAQDAVTQETLTQEMTAHEAEGCGSGALTAPSASASTHPSASLPAAPTASAPSDLSANAHADPPGQPAASIPGLARALIRDLGCEVVAMRYPVADEFAIAYTSALYDQLLAHRKPLDQAAAHALAEATSQAPSPARPPLSIATPGLFTARRASRTGNDDAPSGATLRLLAPTAPPDFDVTDPKLAFFEPPHGPGEPGRFVGRASAMARASAALAPGSGRTAVLLHGMAGSGKTTCAMELAYRHQDAFAALAFWQAPTRDDEWQAALGNLATRLETQLGQYRFQMVGHIGTEAALEAYLPVLRHALRNTGILLVLDNLETLLTPEGTWRDPRWTLLINALISHDGESRVIMTSRIAPAGMTVTPVGLSSAPASGRQSASPSPQHRVLTLPVHALSLSESVALARELPNLRALLHSDTGAVRKDNGFVRDDNDKDDNDKGQVSAPVQPSEARIAADRDLVRRVLRVVQGHPKLMELADAAATDRFRLTAPLQAAENAVRQAERGQAGIAGELAAFFRHGESTLDPDQFLAALSAWTTSALGVLSPDTRLMAEFLACLEDDDRASHVIDATWPPLWQRLGRPSDAPEPAPLLRALAEAALVETETLPATDSQRTPLTYRIHPGVASAFADAVPADVREAADALLAAFWRAVFDWAREREDDEDSALVVRAGLAAAPYLLRQGEWNTASILLEQATIRDESPGLVQAVLPSLRRIADATGAPDVAGVLARVLMRVDRAEAERLLRGALDAAAGAGDYRVASHIAGQLFNLLLGAGRLGEALAVVGQLPEFTRRAGFGPWTQLADQARRLQVLGLMGDHAQVLAEVDRLRAAIADLPGRRGPDEPMTPWNVREVILNIGNASALATGEWARCLELNAEIVASMRGRGAGAHQVARFRFNDAGPLVRLGRLAEAGRLLAECQRVFEDHADTANLATVLSARADLEASLGRPGTAADLERAALRLRYARPEPRSIVISHHNLAIYLGRLGGDRAERRAHRLAAALIYQLTGMAHDLAGAVRALAAELRTDNGAEPSLPSTVARVVEVAEQTEGVRLAGLLAALEPDPAAIESALSEILAAATETSDQRPEEPPD